MTPDELVQAAQAHGMPALGLTDHHLLTGAIEFLTAWDSADPQLRGRSAGWSGQPAGDQPAVNPLKTNSIFNLVYIAA